MTEFHLRMTNTGDHELDFVVEPWGNVLPMPPGATFEIAFQAEGEVGDDAPEVQWSARAITVYAGRSSSFSIVQLPVASTNGAHSQTVHQLA